MQEELIRQAHTTFGEEVETVLQACEVYYMNGAADEVSGDVDAPTGHFYLIDRWIVLTDAQGYNILMTFDTLEEARREFNDLATEYSDWARENEEGYTLVEYALIIAACALLLMVSVTFLYEALEAYMKLVAERVEEVP